tara:strand:+ start:78 stop:395 length:318 start_codon:yes stop_codon:yes gene_type:complete
MTTTNKPAYKYSAEIRPIVYGGGVTLEYRARCGWLDMAPGDDGRRWKVTIWRTRRGCLPERVWTKVYKRNAAAVKAARDYPGRYASRLARTGRCASRKGDRKATK